MAILCGVLMVGWEREKAEAVESMLKEAGFTVSQICNSRPSCFDIAVRKGEKLVLLKFQSDVDSLSLEDSIDLETISGSVSATSLLIGSKTREKPLEDDTIYTRYNVLAITPRTFENIVFRKIYPIIQAGPGGFYVEVDSETVKRRRDELGFSVGDLAETVGISRRTLYGYERGMAKASVAAAYNLIYVLGVPVARPVDVFEKSRSMHRRCFLSNAKHAIASKVLQRIFRKFSRYHVATVKRAPFDFVITVPEKTRIIGGVAHDGERELKRRVDEILSVSRVLRAHAVFITDKQRLSGAKISCIQSDELVGIREPEELVDRVT